MIGRPEPIARPFSPPQPPQSPHKQRVLVGIVPLVGMAAAFLPWVHFPILGQMTGITLRWGMATLMLFALAALAAVPAWDFQVHSRGMRPAESFAAVVSALAAAAIGAWQIWVVESSKHEMRSDLAKETDAFSVGIGSAMTMAFQVGIGVYVVIGAALAIVVIVWLGDRAGGGAPVID